MNNMKQEILSALTTVETALTTAPNQIELERLLERRACLRRGLERIAAHERGTM